MDFKKNVIGFNKADWKLYVVLVAAPLLLSIYYYFGYGSTIPPANFAYKVFSNFATMPDGEVYARIYQFVSFFILCLIIPSLFQKFVIKKSFKEIGFGFGDTKFGLKLLLFVPLIMIILYFGTDSPDVKSEYPLAKLLHTRHDLIFMYEICYVLFYYVAWEFFFRGFILFNLKDKMGGFNAILIQTISSCLIHLGKPGAETIGAIAIGILFGIFALRSRSIWYVFLLHIVMGLSTDLYIIFVHGI
jgi:membrane protease YdiL (CAAX protease family)